MRFSYFLFVIAIAGLFSACSESESSYTVIKGATLYDGTGGDAIENSVIIVRNDEIDCVGKAEECSIPLGSEVIDAAGKYITPGLVDAHMHFFQTGF